MSSSKQWLPAVLAAALLTACAEAGPTDPGASPAGVELVAPTDRSARAPIDVSGDWNWTREEILSVPADWAFIFGLQPEGPITHFRCELEGVISLDQNGNTLSGVEVETDSRCETRGGQVVVQPGLGVQIPISEGRVVGRNVHLLIGDAILPCPVRAIVEEIDGGSAVSMRGTGRCTIPGHPKSDAPEGSPLDLDPPPKGTEKILRWEATRPV